MESLAKDPRTLFDAGVAASHGVAVPRTPTCCRCKHALEHPSDVVRVHPCTCCYCKDCFIGILARASSSSTLGGSSATRCVGCKIYMVCHELVNRHGVSITHSYQQTDNSHGFPQPTSQDPRSYGFKRKLPIHHHHAAAAEQQTTSPVAASTNFEKKSQTVATAKAATTRKSFDERYADLVRFHKRHGHCMVPYTNSEGHASKLAEWVKCVRALKFKVTDEQRQRLDDLGFCWDKRFDHDWKIMFAQLCAYKAEHGNVRVPWEWPGNLKLSRWVHTQRKYYAKGKIRADRQELLDSVGMVWKPSEFSSASASRKKKSKNRHHRTSGSMSELGRVVLLDGSAVPKPSRTFQDPMQPPSPY